MKTDIIKSLIFDTIPKQLIIQITDLCNATCPQCGMNTGNRFERRNLNSDDVLKIIDIASENNVKAISFTGGEPLIFQDQLFEFITYAGKKGIPYIRTGTNGFIFMGSEKSDFEYKINKLAQRIKDSGLYTFWISLDSWDVKKHEKNRGLNGVVKGIEKSLKIFEKYNLYPSVNLGINRLIEVEQPIYYNGKEFIPEAFYENYLKGLSKFFQFASDIGFTIGNLCYPMSQNGAVYKAESSDRIVKYSKEEKLLLFKAIYDTVPKFRKKLRIFTPLSSIHNMIKQYEGKNISLYGCRGGKEFYFIDNNGDTYPCGFLIDENLGKFSKNLPKTEYICQKCDWECFRDPSNLFQPLILLKESPLKNFLNILYDIKFHREWLKDIIYYKKCNFFDMNIKKSF